MGKATNIKIHKGDITKLKVDCIVNAANNELYGGSGVCGAIFEAAGYDDMTEACKELGGCKNGEAVITPGFKLPAKHVVHAVGPIYRDGTVGEAGLLKSAYLEALRLAEENGARSIAFPLISTGIFGYPKAEAIKIALDAIEQYQEKSKNPINKITLCAFNDREEALLRVALDYRSGKIKKMPPAGWGRFVSFGDELMQFDTQEETDAWVIRLYKDFGWPLDDEPDESEKPKPKKTK